MSTPKNDKGISFGFISGVVQTGNEQPSPAGNHLCVSCPLCWRKKFSQKGALLVCTVTIMWFLFWNKHRALCRAGSSLRAGHLQAVISSKLKPGQMQKPDSSLYHRQVFLRTILLVHPQGHKSAMHGDKGSRDAHYHTLPLCCVPVPSLLGLNS